MLPGSPSQSAGSRSSIAIRLFIVLLVALLFCVSLSAAIRTSKSPKAAKRQPSRVLSTAGQAVKLKPSAIVQMNAIRAIKTAKSDTDKKIDSRLFLAMLHEQNDPRLAPLTDFRFVKADTDGTTPVEVTVATSNGVQPVATKVTSLGGDVQWASPTLHRVSAKVHLADLESLAAMPGVSRVAPPMPRKLNKVNTSEGDKTHGADEARGFFGVTGVGVKVGVISDGVDSITTLEASGDVAASVDVLAGQAGSGDEGSAMLEIVHDLAPGAAEAFATADPDEGTFAANILALQADGCNIIIDDVSYLDESPFEDGPVAQAVNTVTAAGVLYFSAAGNEGNKDDGTSATWEGDFLATAAADPAPLAGANLADFGDGGNSLQVAEAGGDAPVLIWAEHYNLTNGFASTDFDLYDMDGGLTTIFDASTDTQDGTGGDDFPIEIIGGGTFSGERLLIDKFAGGTTSSVPMFNLIIFGDGAAFDPTLATNGATRGHSAAAAAFSVAATPAAGAFETGDPSGPFPGLFTAANVSETFTSDGPRRIILNGTDGSEITAGNRTSTGGTVRQKPDITAADGVSCAAPGFNPFFGTSAATPHAAAIAALLESAVPGITPAQVRTALVSSAIDIENTGTDRDTGAGIVMAHAALAAAGAVPMAFLSAGAAVQTQVVGDSDAFVEPNETWSLTIPVTNDGGATATAITGVLTTSTSGVVISSGSSSYPDLAAGASGNNATPFTFFVGPSVACGTILQFTLTLSYTGGSSPQTFNYTVPTGAPGTPVTFSFTGPPVPIPDSSGANVGGTPAFANLPVSGLTGSVFKVELRIDGSSCNADAGSTTVGIDHSFINDLEITLLSPSGTPVLVINRTDGGGNNLCNTLLDDDSAGPSIQSVASSDAPFTGTFTPNAPLSAFLGEDPNGTWQLEAQDFFIGDTGNIRAFSIIITPAVCDAPAQTANVTATKAVSGTFKPGSPITYTIVLTNSGNLAQADNPGHEFTDVLPAGLTLVSATATSGTPVATVATRTVTWDGSIPASGGSVTITIDALVNQGTGGTTISNQGSVSFDANGDGTNDTTIGTDNPATPAAGDATSFAVAEPNIPTLSGLALLILGVALALVAIRSRHS